MTAGSLREEASVYRRLIGAAVRAEMQSRINFAIRTGTDFLVVFSDFLPVYFLLLRFGALQGWSVFEMALLYGMVGCSWAVVEMAFRGFENFGRLLIRGDLDRLLLRPRPLVLQIAAQDFELRRIGRLAQASVVLAIGAWGVGIDARGAVWVAVGVAGGTAFFCGVVLCGAALQMLTLGQTSELQNVLTYGGTAALTYPVSIYARWFRRVITYVVPLAFVNYFPALAALDRVSAEGWPAWLPYLSPLVCGAVVLAGHRAFGAALRRYASTGS